MAVLTKSYASLPVSRREILRYMGCSAENAEISELIDSALALCEGVLAYRVCFDTFDVKRSAQTLDLGFAVTDSLSLAKNLEGCEKIVLFCATVGHSIDRLIAREGARSPALALCLQAVGAERIEALCDAFCSDMAENYRSLGFTLRPRFSAGYGDLSIELQRDIVRVLDANRRIGVTLTESLMMSPSKSVSAIVGIKNKQI